MNSVTENKPQHFYGVPFSVCIAIAIAFLVTYLAYHSSLGLASGILFIIVGLYPFVRALLKREFDAFEIINLFVLYMILGIGIRGLVGMKYGSYFLEYDPLSDHFDLLRLKVFSYSTIALLFLYLGYYSRFGDRWINILSRLSFDWHKQRALIALVLYLLIGGLATAFFTIKFGRWEGIESFGKHPGQYAGQVKFGGMTHITVFMRFYFVAFFATCIYLFTRRKPGWVKVLFLLSLLEMSFTFINFGSKTTFFMALLGYAMARHYLKRRIGIGVFVVLVLAIFILSPLLWHIRSYGIYRGDILAQAYAKAIDEPIDVMMPLLKRSYSFDSFALFIESIDSGYGLELGGTMKDLLFFYIPRVIWQTKPLPFTVTFLPEYANMNSPGAMAPSLPGELYINFHLIGIIAGFLLLGIVMKMCYRGLIQRNMNKSSLLVYIPVTIMTPLLFEGGLNKLESYILILLPVVLFLWFVKSTARSRQVN